MPKEGLHRYHGRLIRFLKGIAHRLQLLTALEFLLLLASLAILLLLGSFFVFGLEKTIPYLPFFYLLLTPVALVLFVVIGCWRMISRPSMERVASGLERKFPQLRDDVTNSLLLFEQFGKGLDSRQISESLMMAHIRKTAEEVSKIHPSEVVNLKYALRHLRLLIPLFIAFSVVFAMDPHFLNRSLANILHPFSALPMRETLISLEPVKSIVLRGTPLLIRAKATGKIPERLTLMIWPEGANEIRLNMESEGDGVFRYQIGAAQTSFRYQAIGGRGSSPTYGVRVVDPPEVGKLKLTLIPPDYTRLPREIKEEGHIEALKGTVVHLEAQSTAPLKEGKIVLNQESPLALNVKGDLLSGSFVVLSAGSYSLQIKDLLGFENSNPVQYRIFLVPDKYPEGEIVEPGQDLEVTGTEIIPLTYTAKDDFGITAVRLSYQVGGAERTINLQSDFKERALGPEEFKWDLTSLALMPGDRVAYRLEIWDNDSVSGPKVGHSKTFTFSVKDERDRASKEAEETQKIADTLLDLLADHLEEIRDREALSEGLKEVLERVDKNLQRMGDKTERYDLEALKRNLTSLNQRIQQESKETVTQEMERLSHLSEDISKKARMSELEAMAREIRNRQRRLIDALRDTKGPLSREAQESMLKELDKLRELLHSVMDALGKMAAQLPDEFMNSPELSDLDFQDLFKDLDEIQKKLMEGDLAGALEAAQRLLQALSEMMAALGRAGSQANMNSYDRLQSEMSRQTSELDRIAREQREILSGTEGIDQDLKRRFEEEIEKRRNLFQPRFEEEMEKLRHALRSEQRDSVDALEKLFKAGQLEKFSELAEELKKELSGNPEAQKLLEALMEIAENVIPDPEEMMTSENRERFPDLSSRQDKLQKRTRNLAEKLEMLAQLFPGLDTEILNDLKEAAGSMEQAHGKLAGEDAPGAIPPEQEALQRLAKSQQAMKQMAQQMAMRMQANRWGYPLAYDPRPGWYYGPWVPMPTLPQPELRRPREKGYTGIDREEFDPPSKDAYKTPQLWREKVMESLKEGVPSQYRREVERYFRGLTE